MGVNKKRGGEGERMKMDGRRGEGREFSNV